MALVAPEAFVTAANPRTLVPRTLVPANLPHTVRTPEAIGAVLGGGTARPPGEGQLWPRGDYDGGS